MSYSIGVLTVLTVAVLDSYVLNGQYYGGGQPAGRGPMCSSPYKPCRTRMSSFEMESGDLAEANEAETCSCRGGQPCSSNWNDGDRVVSRKLISSNLNMTFGMMFCGHITPLRFCRRRDISIEFHGSLMLPTDITAYNCRCRRWKNLVLAVSEYREDYLHHHSYKCSNHVPTCPGSRSPCLVTTEFRAEYPCQCPGNSKCQADPNGGMYGYCTAAR